MNIGNTISELRKKNHLTQEDLAEKLNVTRQTISKWECNETSPSLEDASKLAKIFKVSLDELTNNPGILEQKMSNVERLAGIIIKILKVIGNYSKALDLLDDYDHRTLKKIDGNIDERKIEYSECIKIINKLRFNEGSSLFAIERDRGLESIIGNIYQSFDGKDVYKSIEEKGANFLYLIVKNHVFADGNKRIAATLFVYFLNFYGILYKNGKQTIDNNTLAALTLLIAESNPKEKDVIIDLVMNFLNNE